MKVFTIWHDDYGKGWTDTSNFGIKCEIESEIAWNSEDFSKYDMPADKISLYKLLEIFINNLEKANIGEKLKFGMYEVEVEDIDKEEYENMEEFAGW